MRAHLPWRCVSPPERTASRPGMPLSDLIADLRDESALWDALSTGDPDEADAVRTVFAWSYRALPENAARLFCLLGLHPGGDFSTAAAEVLAGPTADQVHISLDVLVGAHLLENKGLGRYQFHDLLRAYAVDRARFEVPQEEQLAAIDRICAWYLHSAYECVLAVAHDTTLLFSLEPSSQIKPMTFADRTRAAQWYAEESPTWWARCGRHRYPGGCRSPGGLRSSWSGSTRAITTSRTGGPRHWW
jgi:hypothetical protein